MSRFWINGRFLHQRMTGVQRYATQVVENLDRMVDKSMAVLAVPSPIHNASYSCIDVNVTSSAHGHAWEQMVLAFKADAPILNLCNSAPLIRRDQTLCIHDANVFEYPETYSFSYRMAYRLAHPVLARQARYLTTVSAYSAQQIAAHLDIPLKRILVLPNGHEHVSTWDAARSKISLSDRPYVLVIGSKAKHKNIGAIIQIAEALDDAGLDLIIAGGGDRVFADASHGDARNVRQIDGPTDHDLGALLKTALCLVFPSFTEGFGLPLVEAMAIGCPVISSDRASMPEVCGTAALYASPQEPAAWLAQILKLKDSPNLRDDLRGRGFEQVQRFRWPETARGYLDLMQEF